MQTSAGDGEGEHQARPGLLRADCGQHEDAGADDAADAEQRQLEPAQSPLEGFLFSRREDRIKRLNPAEQAPLGATVAIRNSPHDWYRARTLTAEAVRAIPVRPNAHRASIGPSGRPPKRCRCRCGTSCPEFKPTLASTR